MMREVAVLSETAYSAREKFVVFFACALGWAHDAIGLTLINFLTLPIMAEFGVTEAHLGFIMSAQYIATVPGAIIFGELADRFGRKNFLLVSILWDSLLTAASALAPNYFVLAALRIISGMGVSWGIAFALLGEVYSPKRRGFFGGLVHATFIVGYIGSALTTMLLRPVFLPILGSVLWWRPCFLIALFPLPFLLVLYFVLPESRLWRKYSELEAGEGVSLRAGLVELGREGYLKLLFLCMILFWAAEFAYHAFVDWGPTFLQVELSFSESQAETTVMLIALVLLVVFPLVGLLSDKIGRRYAFTLSAIVGLVGSIAFGVFMLMVFSPMMAVSSLFILSMGFSSHALFGVWSSEIFPTKSRAAANSLIFSVARGFSLGAWIVGILATTMLTLTQAMLVGAIGFVLMVLLSWTLPETKGKELSAM